MGGVGIETMPQYNPWTGNKAGVHSRSNKMPVFNITANDTDMGEYTADGAADALDKYARDAGYTDYADASAQVRDDAQAVEIDTDALCNAVTEKTGFNVFQDSYGNGIALVNGTSYASYQELANSIGMNSWDFKR